MIGLDGYLFTATLTIIFGTATVVLFFSTSSAF